MSSEDEYLQSVSESAAPFGLSYWYAIYRNAASGQTHALRQLAYSEADMENDFAKDNQLFGWEDELLIVTNEPPPDLPINGFRPRL